MNWLDLIKLWLGGDKGKGADTSIATSAAAPTANTASGWNLDNFSKGYLGGGGMSGMNQNMNAGNYAQGVGAMIQTGEANQKQNKSLTDYMRMFGQQ